MEQTEHDAFMIRDELKYYFKTIDSDDYIKNLLVKSMGLALLLVKDKDLDEATITEQIPELIDKFNVWRLCVIDGDLVRSANTFIFEESALLLSLIARVLPRHC